MVVPSSVYRFEPLLRRPSTMLLHVTALAVIGCNSSTADTVRAAVFFSIDICFSSPVWKSSVFILYA